MKVYQISFLVIIIIISCKGNLDSNVKNSHSSNTIDLTIDSSDFWLKKIDNSKFVLKEKKRLGLNSFEYRTFKEIDSNGETLYKIKLGRTSDIRYEAIYNFYINPKSKSVKIYDPLKDSLTNFDLSE